MKLFINDIDKIKEFVAINASLAFETIKPYLIQSQRRFILPLVGNDLFSLLVEYYNSDTPTPNELYDDLVEAIQEPLANYALYLYTPIAQVQVSDSGINRVENEQNKSAYQYQINELRKSWLETAHEAVDSLLALLDATDSETLPEWHNSTEFTANKSLFINNAEQFTHEVAALNYSRRLFIHLKPILRSVEKRYLLPTISAGLFAELKNQMATNTLTDANKALIEELRPAAAYLTMAKAVVSLSVEVLTSGVVENYTSLMINEKASVQASAGKLHDVEQSLLAEGRAALVHVTAFLVANHADYPLYESSGLYTVPVDGEVVEEPQSGGLFIM